MCHSIFVTHFGPWYKDKGMFMRIEKSRDSQAANQNCHQAYVIITR